MSHAFHIPVTPASGDIDWMALPVYPCTFLEYTEMREKPAPVGTAAFNAAPHAARCVEALMPGYTVTMEYCDATDAGDVAWFIQNLSVDKR